jgi:hypothetical protein
MTVSGHRRDLGYPHGARVEIPSANAFARLRRASRQQMRPWLNRVLDFLHESIGSRPVAGVVGRCHNGQQRFDIEIACKGQSEGQVGFDLVRVSTPLPMTIEIPSADEIGDNTLCCPLGDVQQDRKITKADSRIASDQQERVAVICKEPKVRNGTHE